MRKETEKPVIIIALITAVCLLGDTMLYIVLPVYWHEFGLTSLWQVGVLLSVNRFVRLPLSPLVGWLYYRISKRMGVMIAVSLTVISTFAYGFVQGFWLLFIARCLWGVAWAFLRLGGFLTVLDVADQSNRGFLIGKYNGLWALGGLAGMLAGGLLTDSIGIEAVTVIFATLALISIPFVFFFVPANVSSDDEEESGRESMKQVWKGKNVIPVMITGLIMAMVFFGIFMSTLSRITEVNYPSLTLFGMTIGAATLAGVIQSIRWGWEPFIAPRFGRLSDGKLGRTPFLITALFLGAGWFAILPLDLSPLFWIVVVLFLQLTWTMTVTLTDSLAADVSTKSGKVVLMTTYTIVVDVGAAIGPSFGYMISDFFSMSALYWITSGLLFCLGLFWMVKNIREKRVGKRRSNKDAVFLITTMKGFGKWI